MRLRTLLRRLRRHADTVFGTTVALALYCAAYMTFAAA